MPRKTVTWPAATVLSTSTVALLPSASATVLPVACCPPGTRTTLVLREAELAVVPAVKPFPVRSCATLAARPSLPEALRRSTVMPLFSGAAGACCVGAGASALLAEGVAQFDCDALVLRRGRSLLCRRGAGHALDEVVHGLGVDLDS